ncbi:MAG: M48 family metallopeptidase, partial [Bacteroidota bacterium]|nr:M48 family metallopeptidase [Bacteroidota bacterium]
MQNNFIYPPSPIGINKEIITPSPEFKKKALHTLGSIFIFALVYIVLMTLALLLTIAASWAGLSLIIAFPKFYTLMIGGGLIGLGLMVSYFMVKFIFSKNVVDRSGLIEIHERDQPVLFSFIKEIANETMTNFPKKIYLSPEVNASVFYDSSFWSMFFPVRKNLIIGLGLVNSITISELKAVLAHEFGHFSQRSMKIGSYVYNVNKIIYNLLYENDDYGKTISEWSNISGFFA